MSCFEQSSFANGFPMNWAILGGGQLGTEMRGRNNSDHSVISMVLSLPFKSFGPMLSDHLQGVLGWPCGDTEHDHAVLTHLSTVRKSCWTGATAPFEQIFLVAVSILGLLPLQIWPLFAAL